MKKSELLEGLHQSIDNALNENQNLGTSGIDFSLKRIVNETLIETKSTPEILNILQPFDAAINEGVSQLLLIRPLLESLDKFSPLFGGIKKNCATLKKLINENLDDINLAELYEAVQNPNIKNFLEPNFRMYINNKSLENKASLVGLLESSVGYDNSANGLLTYLRDGNVNTGASFVNLYESNVNESEVIDVHGQKFVQTADGQIRPLNAVDMNKVYEAADAYVENLIAESNARQEEKDARSYKDFNSELHLYEHIRTLQTKCSHNANLQAVLNEYASALQAGCREEMLYETFCQRMHEGFDYLVAVTDATSRIAEAANAKRELCDFIKILETMSNTPWANIVPLIESVVIDYMENPNPQTRNIMLNQLRMYENCPYVVDMIIVANNQHDLGCETPLSETFSSKDSEKFIRQHAHLENVYSPVQYIKENESIFNVEGQFFVKKGQNITKLSKDAIQNLSESFIALCRLVNDPHVAINEAENKISLYTNDKVIEITDKFAKIDDVYESLDNLKNTVQMHLSHSDVDEIDILKSAFLLENFDNIAKIDFVTKIAMNESDNKSLDLFKVKDNIFVMSHDNINEEHTFYRNVKPLQLKNIINNHFGLNVSNLFEDLMPNQDKIVAELNEIRNEYENKINSLLEMKQEFEETLEEIDEAAKPKLKKTIKEIDKKIEEAKKDYKKFQKKANEIENGKDCDNDAEVLNELGDVNVGSGNSVASGNQANGNNVSPSTSVSIPLVPEGEEDGSDDDFSDDVDGGDFTFDGGDDFGDEFDGSDGFLDDEEDGSDFSGDEFTTSDGDDMTQSIDGGESFETDPFNEEDGSDFDFSANGSQDGDYSFDDEIGAGTDEFGEPLDAETPAPETPEDIDIDDDSVMGAEDDPFGAGANVEGDTLDGPDADGETEDAATGQPEEHTAEVDAEADLDYANFKIVKIDFDKNVRTGEKKSTGKAIVVVPWIDDFGNKTSETKTIDFYITDIQGEKGVVLDTNGMSVEMYNAVTSAIKKSADFSTTEPQANDPHADATTSPIKGGADDADVDTATPDSEGLEGEIKGDPMAMTPAPVNPTDTEFDPMGDDETGTPFDSGSDETTVLTIDDGIEPHGIDVPGDDTIPAGAEGEAPEVDDEEIPATPAPKAPMENPIIDIIGESKKAPKKAKSLNESTVNSDPFEHLFESVNANAELPDSPAQDGDSKEGGYELVTSEVQEDPIAVIEDVLLSYADELSEDGEESADVEVGDIEDYDIDGSDVSVIKATIGANEYAFFSYDDKVYSCLAEDFDDNSDDLETLEDFIASGDENLAEAETTDVHSIVELVTDVIATETGDEFDYAIEGDDEVDEVIDENPVYASHNDLDENGNF